MVFPWTAASAAAGATARAAIAGGVNTNHATAVAAVAFVTPAAISRMGAVAAITFTYLRTVDLQNGPCALLQQAQLILLCSCLYARSCATL